MKKKGVFFSNLLPNKGKQSVLSGEKTALNVIYKKELLAWPRGLLSAEMEATNAGDDGFQPIYSQAHSRNKKSPSF